MTDINSIPELLLQRVVGKIVADIASPTCVTSLGDMCLLAYVSGGPSEVLDGVGEITNYDGPDNWDVEACASWLRDRDLFDQCPEWEAVSADPYGRLLSFDEELAEWVFEYLVQKAPIASDDEMDSQDWALAAWDALDADDRRQVESVLCEKVVLWADDLDTWRQVVADNWERPEVYQWFAMDDRFIDELERQGEVTMSAFNLDMWGRQGCGQAIYLDDSIRLAASRWFPYYTNEFPELKQYL